MCDFLTILQAIENMNKMGEFRKQQLEVSNIREEWLKIANKLEPLQEEAAQIMELFLVLKREIKEPIDECS